MVLYDGQGGWDVAFYTSNAKDTWYRACRVTLKPVKITNCQCRDDFRVWLSSRGRGKRDQSDGG